MRDFEFDRDAVWVEQVLDLRDATVSDGAYGVAWELMSRFVTDEEMLEAFAAGLAAALERADIDQAELARRIGASKSTVGNWLAAAGPPRDPNDLFAAEKALGLKAGELSQILGYLPLEAVRKPVSFLEALTASGLAADDQRVIRRIYEAGRPTRGAKRPTPRG